MVFLALVLYMLVPNRRSPYVEIMAGFTILSMFPVVALRHVSELYAYNCTPVISILVGVALGHMWRLARRRIPWRSAAVVLVAVILGSQLVAAREKTYLMKDCGVRASQLLPQIVSCVDAVPRQGELVLLNPPVRAAAYSVFHVYGYDVLLDGLHRIQELTGRPDIKIEILPDSPAARSPRGNRVALTLLGTRVVRADHSSDVSPDGHDANM